MMGRSLTVQISTTGAGPTKISGKDWPAFGIVLAIVLLFADLLSGKTLFYQDFSGLFLPQRDFISSAWSRGELPAWASDLGMGIPILGNPMLGTFYPPHLLLSWLPTPWGINASLVVHLVFAFLGMRLLLVRLTGDRWAAALGGITFALSGCMVASTVYVYLTVSWAWVPWFIATCVRAQDLASRRSMALGAVCLMMIILAGSPTGVASAVVVGGIMCVFCQAQPAPRATLYAMAPRVVVALLLAAVQLLPALYLLTNTYRAGGLRPEQVLEWSLHPERLLAFLNPFPFGTWGPELSFFGMELSGEKARGVFFYSYFYVGVAPLLLALPALGGSRHGRLALVLVGTGVLTLLLALGEYLPPSAWILTHMPGLSFLRYPERLMMVLTLLFSLLAGLGAARLGEKPAGTPILVIAGALVLSALLTLVLDGPIRAWIEPHLPIDIAARVADAARALQNQGALLVIAVTLAFVVGTRPVKRRPVFHHVMLLAALVEMGVAARQVVWTSTPDLLHAGKRTADVLRADGSVTKPFVVLDEASTKTFPYHQDLTGLQRHQALEMLRMRRNYPFFEGLRQSAAETPAFPENPINPTSWVLANPGVAGPLLGVSHIIVGEKDAPAPVIDGTATGTLRMVAHARALGIRIVAPRTPALPHAWCSTSFTLDETAAYAMKAISDPTPVSRLFGPPSPPPHASFIPCVLHQTVADGRITAQLQNAPQSLLVLQDRFSPGWLATADGEPVPVVRAYGTLVAAFVPAGAREIKVWYDPPGFRAGLKLSLLGALALLLLLVPGRWLTRPRPVPRA